MSGTNNQDHLLQLCLKPQNDNAAVNTHDDLRKKGKWFKDVRIHRLDDSNSKDEVSAGYKHATAKFDQCYAHLKEILAQEIECANSKTAGKKERAAKLEKQFMDTACLVQYYSDQMERIIMIWSRKTGCPSIVMPAVP